MAAVVTAPDTLAWIDRRSYPFAPHYVEVDGGRMHTIDEGKGQAVLFVHGTPTWSFVFRHLVRVLMHHNRCIAPDLLGFGLSDKPTKWAYSPTAHAKNLRLLVDALGVDNLVLVGYGLGGPLCLSLATERPDRVAGIILINSWLWDLSTDPGAGRLRALVNGPIGRLLYTTTSLSPLFARRAFVNRTHCTEEFVKMLYGPYSSRADREGLFETCHHMLAADGFYGEIWRNRDLIRDIPTLLLWGERDYAFGKRALNKVWHEFPTAEVRSFENSGYFVLEERPADSLDAVRGFLHNVQSRAASAM